VADSVSIDPPGIPWWSRTTFWLVVMVVAFYAISVYAGVLGYYNFQLQNAGDAGIITQAVTSTARGGVPPFFEAWDCLYKQRCSFLLVHPAFVLYAEVPVFILAPSTLTLFAIRAGVVAAAAVPLYWLTRQLTRSGRLGLLAAAIYLVWAPTSTDDFSLHMESYLPLEILLLVALWQAGRYRWGLLVAVATFLTIEVGPVFTFLVGIFFLLPSLGGQLAASWQNWCEREVVPFSLRSESRAWIAFIRTGLGRRWVQYTLGLVFGSMAAYVTLLTFMNGWGPGLLGVPHPSTGTGLLGLFYNPSSPSPAPISAVLTSGQTISSAEYWILLYALVGFVPLLCPRALILSIPWIGWTFLSDSNRFTTLGHQYSFVAAGPIFVGFAYGLQYLYSGPLSPERAAAVTPRSAPRRWAIARPGRRVAAFGVIIGIVVVANLALLPFDPMLPGLGYQLGGPIEPEYFDHSLQVIPGWSETSEMVGIVPGNATIAAPGGLYALIAMRHGAVVLRGANDGSTQLLPFNFSEGPEFVLLYNSVSPPLTSRGWDNFSEPSRYGLRAYVASTGIGPVFLYQRGWSSVAEPFGAALSPSSEIWLPTSGLEPGALGTVARTATSPSGAEISSNLSSHATGQIWSGTTSVLAAGTYSIDVTVALTAINGTVRPGQVVVGLDAYGFGRSVFDENLTYSDLASGAWTRFAFNTTLTSPLPAFELDGNLRDEDCQVAVASIEIVPQVTD
jgi:uncharacterized membrane protein